MDRRILFPVVAATAWAQQASPDTAEAEKALHARVDQFYNLMIAKKFRQAESLVAEESKDEYYNGQKPDLNEFTFSQIEFMDGGQKAKVIVKAPVKVMLPGAGSQTFVLPVVSTWERVNGEWMWYIDKDLALQTPFGKIKPGPTDAGSKAPPASGARPTAASLAAQVKIDRTEVILEAGSLVQSATITNNLPGPVVLSMDDRSSKIKGLSVKIDKSQLGAGEKAEVRLEAAVGAVISDVVRVFVAPLGIEFDIRVRTN